jgi:hypothetical protein
MWYRKRHVAEKFRYHIGNTDTTSVFSDTTSVFSDTTSVFSDTTSVFSDTTSVFPMWYRNFSATCLSDTTSEIISNRLYKRRLLADFRPVVGPAYGSRMVANQIRADRAKKKGIWQSYLKLS